MKVSIVVWTELTVASLFSDEKINVLNGLLDAAAGARGSSTRKNAASSTRADDSAFVDASKARFQQSIEEYDPNEPVYCVCR